MKKNLLNYNFPQDLKKMNIEELNLLAVQIREFLVDNISETGGHLASNLGAVELTIALHKFFDTPKDKIIWDVGHQSYVHKILSGRANKFYSLRQFEGLSGFPKISESKFDTFDTGHSSNSVSLAAGFAVARDLNKENCQIISVIGDGALTGGLSYEGLNNLGGMNTKAIIILNDNGMSIGHNTGGLSKHLSKVRVSKSYSDFKKSISGTVKKLPYIGEKLYSNMISLRNHIKYSIVDGVMFEQLGFTYIGPIDGHNIDELIYNLRLAKTSEDSIIMHIVTKKGKGYLNAEKNPSKFHGIGPFNKTTGNILSKSNKPSYSQIFGDKLLELAKSNKNIVAVSAAMVDGTGLRKFAEVFPDRIFDVGIAEGHAVTFAGALGKNGLKPVVAIYSTFLQRAYDNIMTDVCLQNSSVVFAIDRAGNVGEDGETHHGLLDIAYLKNIPNIKLLSPATGEELKKMLAYAIDESGPVAIRYPRGTDEGLNIPTPEISEGATEVSYGEDVEIWAVGNMVELAIEVSELLKKQNIKTGVINARWLSPIDENKVISSANRTKNIITLEDGIISGGFGESISSFVKSKRLDVEILNIGWPHKFIEHGKTPELMA